MAEPPPFNPDTVAGPRFSVSVEYTDELEKRIYRRAYIRRMVFAGAILVVLCLCFTSGREWESVLPGILFLVILFSIVAIANFEHAFQKASRFTRKLDHRQTEFSFDDYGVLEVSAIGTNRFRWDMFTKVARRKEMWSLYFDRKSAFTIPASSMTSDLQGFIVRKCSENRVKVK